MKVSAGNGPNYPFIPHPTGIILGQTVLLTALLISCTKPVESTKSTGGSFTIAFTGADLGVLEPCGCTEKQLGGIGRRAAFLEGILPSESQGIILATGGLAGRVRNPFRESDGPLSDFGPLDIIRYETLLAAFNEMRYSAVSVGPEELAFGLERLRTAAEIADFPFVLTNLSFPGERELPFEKTHTLSIDTTPTAGGGEKAQVVIRIFGLIAPSLASELPEGALLIPLAEAISAETADLPKADINIVLLQGTEEDAREIGAVTAKAPNPWLVIHSRPGSEPGIATHRIVAPGDRGRFVGLSRLRIRAGNAGWEIEKSRFEALDESLPPSETVRLPLQIYMQRIRMEGILDQMVERRPHPSGDSYTGSSACIECHPRNFEAWSRLPHARAYETLLKAEREYDPECLSCHVIGFGFEAGFRSKEATPELTGVGCESCHGPQGRHVLLETMSFETEKCETCHDRLHSPDFDRHKELRKICCIGEDEDV